MYELGVVSPDLVTDPYLERPYLWWWWPCWRWPPPKTWWAALPPWLGTYPTNCSTLSSISPTSLPSPIAVVAATVSMLDAPPAPPAMAAPDMPLAWLSRHRAYVLMKVVVSERESVCVWRGRERDKEMIRLNRWCGEWRLDIYPLLTIK